MNDLTITNFTSTKETDDYLKIILIIITYSFFLLINSFFQGPYFDAFYYWSWGQHLATGYLDGPPLVACFMRFFDLIFGNTIFTINGYGVFTTLCSAFFIFKIGTSLSDNKEIGLGGALLWLISNNTQAGLINRISYDNLEELFWLSTTFFVLQYLKFKFNKSLYYAGISLGLLLLSKYSGIILAFAFFTFFIFTPKERVIFKNKHFYFALLITLLIVSPNLVWNFKHHWRTFVFQQHAHPMSAATHFLSILTCLKGVITHHIYAIPIIIFFAFKHPHLKVNTLCWKLIGYVFITLLLFWLLISYSSTVYHGYFLLLNAPLMILLSYYLINFNYKKTLWFVIAVYSLTSLGQIIAFNIRSQSHIYELTLLKEFKNRYLTKENQPIIVGGNYPFLSKALFINPQNIVSSTPACDDFANQFRYWNSDFQQDLIAHKVPQAFYIDLFDKPNCIKAYFKYCKKLPKLVYIASNKFNTKRENPSLYIYECQNIIQ